MRLTFTLENDHLVTRLDDGSLALLDTGSPYSLGDRVFEFGWESRRPLAPLTDAGALRTWVGAPVEVLVGMDVLGSLCLSIDWRRGALEVLPSAPQHDGHAIAMSRTVGDLPVVPVCFEGRERRWVVDTGARVNFVRGLERLDSDETWKDFVIAGGLHEFESNSRLTEIVVGGCARGGRVARLPDELIHAVQHAGCDGILGVNWLQQSPLTLDFPNGILVVAR